MLRPFSEGSASDVLSRDVAGMVVARKWTGVVPEHFNETVE